MLNIKGGIIIIPLFRYLKYQIIFQTILSDDFAFFDTESTIFLIYSPFAVFYSLGLFIYDPDVLVV